MGLRRAECSSVSRCSPQIDSLDRFSTAFTTLEPRTVLKDNSYEFRSRLAPKFSRLDCESEGERSFMTVSVIIIIGAARSRA